MIEDTLAAIIKGAVLDALAEHRQEPEEVFTVTEAATFLKAETGWVYRHASELGGSRLTPKCLRFRKSALLAYLEKKGTPHGPGKERVRL